MNYIFIDANIYLRFYDSKIENFKKLIEVLKEVQDNIYITKQIQNEIRRNRLEVFLATLTGNKNKFKLSDFNPLTHLDSNSNRDLEKWNSEAKELRKAVKAHERKLDSVLEKLVKNISSGSDMFSEYFENIENVYTPDSETIQKARQRKELGNPPGKRNDPLGDQLTWEQLLKALNEGDKVWIITKDGDYISNYNEKLYLNPYLQKELTDKKVEFFLFSDLSTGLESFKKTTKIEIKSFPNNKDFERIKVEEQNNTELNILLNSINYYPTGSTASFGIGSINTNLHSSLIGSNKSSNLSFENFLTAFRTIQCKECGNYFLKTTHFTVKQELCQNCTIKII